MNLRRPTQRRRVSVRRRVAYRLVQGVPCTGRGKVRASPCGPDTIPHSRDAPCGEVIVVAQEVAAIRVLGGGHVHGRVCRDASDRLHPRAEGGRVHAVAQRGGRVPRRLAQVVRLLKVVPVARGGGRRVAVVRGGVGKGRRTSEGREKRELVARLAGARRWRGTYRSFFLRKNSHARSSSRTLARRSSGNTSRTHRCGNGLPARNRRRYAPTASAVVCAVFSAAGVSARARFVPAAVGTGTALPEPASAGRPSPLRISASAGALRCGPAGGGCGVHACPGRGSPPRVAQLQREHRLLARCPLAVVLAHALLQKVVLLRRARGSVGRRRP